MKKVIIIGSRHSGTKNDPRILSARLEGEGAAVETVYWEDMVLAVSTGSVQIFNRDQLLFTEAPDLVIALGWYKNGSKSIYRDVAYSVALYLESRGIEFWNREMLQQRSTTKLSCMMQLALNGVPVPSTRFSLRNELTIGDQSLPFIAKAVATSRGKSNYLVATEADLEEVMQAETHLLIQPFLPNDHDLRVVCFGGKPSLALRRARAADADTHLNNTSQGGEARWLELDSLPPELLTNSIKICKIMGREMAGIDFIPDAASSFGYSCLEVNAIPQLTSGHDIDKKLDAFVQAIA